MNWENIKKYIMKKEKWVCSDWKTINEFVSILGEILYVWIYQTKYLERKIH